MANLGGFHCWAEPENKDIGIVLSLKEPGIFKIQSATLSDGSVLRTPKSSVAPNSALKFGQTMVVVSRASADIPVSLTVNVESDLKAYSCRAIVLAVTPLPPPQPPPKTFHWTLIRTDDCPAHDIDCSAGSEPTSCNQARLGLVSVCWQHGANGAKPPFSACQGQADWCTYKNVSPDACTNGGHPGNMWTCVLE